MEIIRYDDKTSYLDSPRCCLFDYINNISRQAVLKYDSKIIVASFKFLQNFLFYCQCFQGNKAFKIFYLNRINFQHLANTAL